MTVRSYSNASSQEEEALIISQNPIFAFNMVWRFANDLTLICQLFQKYSFNGKWNISPHKLCHNISGYLAGTMMIE